MLIVIGAVAVLCCVILFNIAVAGGVAVGSQMDRRAREDDRAREVAEAGYRQLADHDGLQSRSTDDNRPSIAGLAEYRRIMLKPVEKTQLPHEGLVSRKHWMFDGKAFPNEAAAHEAKTARLRGLATSQLIADLAAQYQESKNRLERYSTDKIERKSDENDGILIPKKYYLEGRVFHRKGLVVEFINEHIAYDKILIDINDDIKRRFS